MSNSISGNAGMAGATVTLSGAASASTTSAADGTYSFAGLAAGAYTVTPTSAGITFTPASRNETIVATNITGVNFVAQVTGFSPSLLTDNFIRPDAANLGANWTETTDVNAPIAIKSNLAVPGMLDGPGPDYFGVEIYTAASFADDQEAAVTFAAWASNSELDLMVRDDITNTTGYSAVLSGSGAGNLILQDVAGVGTIGIAATVAPVLGDVLSIQAVGTLITVFYNGVPVISATNSTTAAGSPSIYIQSTATQTDTSLSLFTAGPVAFSISGTVGVSGAGATVALSGTSSGTTTADGSGNYSFSGLNPGTYQVTPGLTGSMFSPSQQIVVITAADVTGINFTLFTPAASGAGSGRIASTGASFATRIESPNTEIMGTNLRTRILE